MKAFSIVAIVIASIAILGTLSFEGEDLIWGILVNGFWLAFSIKALTTKGNL